MKTGKFKMYYSLKVLVIEREVPIDEDGDEVDYMADNNCIEAITADEFESKEQILKAFNKIEKVLSGKNRGNK